MESAKANSFDSEEVYVDDESEELTIPPPPQLCGPCNNQGSAIQGVVFCKDCDEFMCVRCKNYHANLKMTKTHTLVTCGDATETAPDTEQKRYMTCSRHPEEELKFFCEKDRVMCCLACTMQHTKCENAVKYIPDIASTFRDSEETRDILQNLESLVFRFEQLKAEISDGKEKTGKCRDVFMKDVETFRQEMNDVVQRIQDAAVSEMNTFYDEMSDKMDHCTQACETTIGELTESYKSIAADRKGFDDVRLFISVQKGSKVVEKMEEKLHDEHKRKLSVQFSFEPSEILRTVLNSVNTLWEMVVQESSFCKSPSHCSCDKPYIHRKAVLQAEFSVNLPKARKASTPNITGSAFLMDESIILADSKNSQLKLHNSEFKCVFSLKLPSGPWDVAVVDSTVVVVTLPDKQKVQVVLVYKNFGSQDKLTLSKTFPTDRECYGIAYSTTIEKLLVACGTMNDTEVQVMDLLGNVIKTIALAKPSTYPRHVRTHKDKMYVSDWKNNSVRTITISSSIDDVEHTDYKNEELGHPYGLCLDVEGNVYVCGTTSNNIHVLSPAGGKVKILLEEKDGIKAPRSIACSNSGGLMLVTAESCDTAKVYKLI